MAGRRALELDLGGEGLLTLAARTARTRFGLDPEHRVFPVGRGPFAIEVEIVARLPFGAPNPDPRLAPRASRWIDVALERLIRRLDLQLAAAEARRARGGRALVEAAARRAGASCAAERDPRLRLAAPDTPLMRERLGAAATGSTRTRPRSTRTRAPRSRAAHAVLDRELAALRERFPPAGALLLTGHAHLDLAWRWPLAETRRKARRTLSTAVGLLRSHPELHFNQSSAQLLRVPRGGRPRAARARRASSSPRAASSRSAACGSSPTA